MFFVLNPGRSGSNAMAQALSQSPNCVCLHEPFPQLIQEAALYRYEEMSSEKISKILLETRRPFVEKKIYGETNNKLSLLIPVLRTCFPNAKFIWLVRDGRDFGCSAIQRGWYSDSEAKSPSNDWQRWRIQGDKAGSVPSRKWNSWNQFEKICWFWTYTNTIIENDLKSLTKNDYLIIRIEELQHRLNSLCEFLGIESTQFIITKTNRRITPDQATPRSEKINVVDNIISWKDWDSKQRKTFLERCGYYMDKLYPQWRDDDGNWKKIEFSDQNEKPVINVSKEHEFIQTPISSKTIPISEINSHLVLIRKELSELIVLQEEFKNLRRQYNKLNATLKETEKKLLYESRLRKKLENQRMYPIYRVIEPVKNECINRLKNSRKILSKVKAKSGSGITWCLNHPMHIIRTLLMTLVLGKNTETVQVKNGKYLNVKTNTLTPILIVIFCDSKEDLSKRVMTITDIQTSRKNFKPLFLIDKPYFNVITEHDFSFEYIPAYDLWTSKIEDPKWEEFYNKRVSTIMKAYQIEKLITWDKSFSVEKIDCQIKEMV